MSALAVRRLGPVRVHRRARRGRRRGRGDRPPGSCSTCATCRWGSRWRRRSAADAWRRAAIGQAMIDFSWAAASRGGGRFDPWFMLGATAPVVSVLGRRDGDRRPRRRPDRRPGRARARRRSSPPSSSASWSRASCAPGCRPWSPALGAPDRPRADPVHARGRAGDRRHRAALPRPARRGRRRSADDRGLGHDRGAHRDDRADPRRRARCCSAAASCRRPFQGVIALVAPALLAALVVVETVGAPEGGSLDVDARVLGVGARRGRAPRRGRMLPAVAHRRRGHRAGSAQSFRERSRDEITSCRLGTGPRVRAWEDRLSTPATAPEQQGAGEPSACPRYPPARGAQDLRRRRRGRRDRPRDRARASSSPCSAPPARARRRRCG